MHLTRNIETTETLEFCLALVRAYTGISRRFDGQLGSFHGISLADFAILLELSRAPGGRLRRVDLADQLGLTASAVTRALIPLEKIGLVSRRPDRNDARVGLAALTSAGRRILEESLETAEMISREVVTASRQDVAANSRVMDSIAGRRQATTHKAVARR